MTTMAEKKRERRIERRGRKPKTGVERYANGSIVNSDRRPDETEESVLAVALAQPHRQLSETALRRAGKMARRTELAGHAAGRAYLEGMIDAEQYEALQKYAGLTVRYMHVVTGRRLSWGSNWPPMLRARQDEPERSGKPIFGEPSDEDIWDLRRAHSDMLTAIQDGREYQEAQAALFQLAVADRMLTGPVAVGALRCALNSLCRLWEIRKASLDRPEVVPSC